jgi:hypothetical protein
MGSYFSKEVIDSDYVILDKDDIKDYQPINDISSSEIDNKNDIPVVEANNLIKNDVKEPKLNGIASSDIGRGFALPDTIINKEIIIINSPGRRSSPIIIRQNIDRTLNYVPKNDQYERIEVYNAEPSCFDLFCCCK